MTLALEQVAVPGRLADVTLTVASGQLVAVVGENGAGKSTLLDVLAGLTPPSSGRVMLASAEGRAQELGRLTVRERARAIASVGADDAEHEDLFVGERIALGLTPRVGLGWPSEQRDARVDAIARELDLEALLARGVATLSSGERRRVSVARALVDDAAGAYVLDEPLSGVDVARQPLVLRALRARAARGAVVVFSVHELGAALHADRVIGLRQGRVVLDGAPQLLDADGLERVFGVRGLSIVRLGA